MGWGAGVLTVLNKAIPPPLLSFTERKGYPTYIYIRPPRGSCVISANELAMHFCGKNVKRRQALLRWTYNMTQVVTKQDTKRVEPYVRMTESLKINLT